ncbi:hypothetical protein DSCW_25750 [Desulfosarcina widdelii]|uniref:Uncharacterized protein n=1 Tax=Desulfosarcina widdelii TaxID=947919 RepID=A0A5K7Z2I6_9BACT|nr:hypothetical protein DSCW_25750 [Desulfosarcina widdelii]
MQGKMLPSLPVSQPPWPAAVNSRINTHPQTILKRAIGRFIGHLVDVRVIDVPAKGQPVRGQLTVSVEWFGFDNEKLPGAVSVRIANAQNVINCWKDTTLPG